MHSFGAFGLGRDRLILLQESLEEDGGQHVVHGGWIGSSGRCRKLVIRGATNQSNMLATA